ncbi:TRAP transporter large permease [Pseudomonas lalucatii]|uniref:TRAP transporter large permease protein n=1 Tax=Pseudomonas lalucatii TaxID=1424203 RepID=A0ABS5Q1E0_9PSED|nr:TRAP transporter large permease [Pseudomonas lalucatii]MBS7662590.1 TRAP transporter large permease [Pseudomonas lalucatii]MBS7690193.1 TRAP transporter large permease [Pseudomonas lalucatii]MBS7725815.1 TRAP transporter large permease [Pseudomonas lalucatii]QVM88579.1 TRAP transporter large permease [Pseudomonas lalucatii]
MTTALLLIMLVLLLAGFPMMTTLLAAAAAGFVFFFTMGPEFIVQQMIAGIRPAALVAVPMFILAADIITRGATANRLLDVATAFVGHVRGGMAVTTALSCALFGALSGSTQATVVGVGSIMRPKMLQQGYKDSFAISLIINASDIALLIPPSIGMIIYGVVSGTSVAELFIAGIGPGLLLMLLLAGYCYLYARLTGIPRGDKFSWRERLVTCRRAILPLLLPVLTIGGIYSGVFSPTEAAAVSVLYALVLEMLIYRRVKFSELSSIALSTGLITAVVFILVAAGAAFSWVISFAQIPQAILSGIGIMSASPTELLIIISIAFFIGCMFVDPIVVMLILVPIFAPAVRLSGLDPVLVGIIITLQAAIGSATPPFGCDIFTAIAVFRRPYVDVVRGSLPFFLILLLMSVLLILFPPITLFLRDLAFR